MSERVNPLTNRPYSQRYYEILKTRRTLPVYPKKEEILNTIKQNKLTLIEGQTGSGKTTQIPQFIALCRELSRNKQVLCTQPKRLACGNVSKRVAEEMDVPFGGPYGTIVGFRMRMSRNIASNTKLVFATDGIILQEASTDPSFSRYSVVVVDEAHERGVDVDVLMGMLKNVLTKRNDLKVIVMSATLDVRVFMRYFDHPPHISVEGRTFPVIAKFLPEPATDYVQKACEVARKIHDSEKEGDILIFLTGAAEIRRAKRELSDGHRTWIVHELYSKLKPEVQEQVHARPKRGGQFIRRVIISTNIAETSITIDGIKYVIDSGFAKMKNYNPEKNLWTLHAQPISRASAVQRAGRAGRTAKGKAYFMYTREVFEKMLIKQTPPEMERTDMVNELVKLLIMDIKNPINFDYITHPNADVLSKAVETLFMLNVIEDPPAGSESKIPVLSRRGKTAGVLPCDIRQGVALLEAAKMGVAEEMCVIVAFENLKDSIYEKDLQCVKLIRRKFYHVYGDQLSFVNTFNRWRAMGSTRQFCKDHLINFFQMTRVLKESDEIFGKLRSVVQAEEWGDCSDLSLQEQGETIAQAYLEGFFLNVAYWYGEHASKKQYRSLRTHCRLRPSPKWTWERDPNPMLIVYSEVVETYHTMMEHCMLIEADWLVDCLRRYPRRLVLVSKQRLPLPIWGYLDTFFNPVVEVAA